MIIYYVIQAAAATTELMLRSCHPGYQFNGETNTCTCSKTRRIVRCDANNRYFYARVQYIHISPTYKCYTIILLL